MPSSAAVGALRLPAGVPAADDALAPPACGVEMSEEAAAAFDFFFFFLELYKQEQLISLPITFNGNSLNLTHLLLRRRSRLGLALLGIVVDLLVWESVVELGMSKTPVVSIFRSLPFSFSVRRTAAKTLTLFDAGTAGCSSSSSSLGAASALGSAAGGGATGAASSS